MTIYSDWEVRHADRIIGTEGDELREKLDVITPLVTDIVNELPDHPTSTDVEKIWTRKKGGSNPTQFPT